LTGQEARNGEAVPFNPHGGSEDGAGPAR
jgi:hypothetical protein